MNNHPEAKWDDVFKVLSYFDIKNLAPWISCPVIMAAGLQDETCPPHTNFAGYNQITSEKDTASTKITVTILLLNATVRMDSLKNI
jgi:cephalosporin-C deacetylase-like acetyl esterase